MKITRRQLRRIIRERAALTGDQIVQYLEDNAENYHQDPTLDAESIAMLLRDDFMDDIGADTPLTDEYEDLIVDLSQGGIVEGKLSEQHDPLDPFVDETQLDALDIAIGMVEDYAGTSPAAAAALEEVVNILNKLWEDMHAAAAEV